MSTDVVVKFYLNGKEFVGKTVCINMLKELLDGWSWAEELVPITNENADPDAGKLVSDEFEYYVDCNNIPEKYKDLVKEVNGSKEIHFDKIPADFCPETEDILKSDGIDLVHVYELQTINLKGNWFDESSFANAINAYEKKVSDLRDKFNSLLGIKKSVEYYKLSDKELERFNDDFEFYKELLEDYENKVYVCRHMIDTMNMFAEMYGNSYTLDRCMIFTYFA